MTHLLLPAFIASSLYTWLSFPLVIIPFFFSHRPGTALEFRATSLPLAEAVSCAWSAGGAGCPHPTTHSMDAFHACMNGLGVRLLLIQDLG